LVKINAFLLKGISNVNGSKLFYETEMLKIGMMKNASPWMDPELADGNPFPFLV
jgi:hypothetical protein